MRRIALVLLTVVVLASPSFAQTYGNRFGSFGRSFSSRTRTRYRSPSRPALSPYLNYFRQDNGVLNPFYNFIQPGRQLQNQSQQIDQRINQQQRQIGVLQQFQNSIQSQRGRGNLTQRATGVGPTGKGATFMNYGGFFQTGGGGGGGQRRR